MSRFVFAVNFVDCCSVLLVSCKVLYAGSCDVKHSS